MISKIKIAITPLILLFNIEYCFCNFCSNSIILKNGNLYDYEISKVNSWGLTLVNGNSIIYKSISQIRLMDKHKVAQIKDFLPSVKVIQNTDSLYILYLDGIIYPKIKSKDDKLTDRLSINYVKIFTGSEEHEIQFNFKFKNMNLISQIAISAGWPSYKYSENVWQIPTTINKKYQIYGVNFGVGYLLDYSKNNFLFLVSYVTQTGNVETIRSPIYSQQKTEMIYHNSFNVCLSYLRSFYFNRFLIGIGMRYFFNKLEIENCDTSYNVMFIMGFNLN